MAKGPISTLFKDAVVPTSALSSDHEGVVLRDSPLGIPEVIGVNIGGPTGDLFPYIDSLD